MSGAPFAQVLPRFGARAYTAGRGIFSPHLRCTSSKHFFNRNPAVLPAQRPRHFHASTATASQLNRMAASKQYRLLCLENPLLGKHYRAVPLEH